MRKKAVHAKIDSLAPFDREKPTKFVFFFFFRFLLFIFHYNWEVEKKIGNLIAATILRVDVRHTMTCPVLISIGRRLVFRLFYLFYFILFYFFFLGGGLTCRITFLV